MNIFDKIKNLREKAANAASTDAEVQAALDHAAKLMKKHGVTEAQINTAKTTSMQPVSWSTGTKKLPEVRYTASAIAAFTETKTWTNTDADGVETIRYIGMDQDVEMALYLTDLTNNAINAAWKTFCDKASDYIGMVKASQRSKMKRDFSRAMASRIRARLMDMVARRVVETRQTTGTELVVMKRDLVNKAQAELGLNLRSVRTRKRSVYTTAHEAGIKAGDKTNLTTGIAA